MNNNGSLERVDRLLSDWQSNVAHASANLLDLDTMLTYKRLHGGDGLPPAKLTGTTLARVAPALTAIDTLWQYLPLLTDAVGHAAALRRSLSKIWVSESTLHEIETILTGPSIQLPATETPLAQRGLLTASEQANSVTPQRLLDVMTREFDLVKTVVIAVDNAWNTLEPAMASAEREASDLQAQAAALGIDALTELTAAQQKLTALRAWVATDPLGVTASVSAEVTPVLQSLRARITEIQRQQTAIASDLIRARAVLAELNDLRSQCVIALKEAQTKIAEPKGLLEPVGEAALTDLAAWFGTIETALAEKRPQAARVGLDRWLACAQGYLTASKAALAADRAPLEARAELRGRLASLRVKAKAYAARGMALDPRLTTLAQEADDALRQAPLSLDMASALVARYEYGLSQCLEQKAVQ